MDHTDFRVTIKQATKKKYFGVFIRDFQGEVVKSKSGDMECRICSSGVVGVIMSLLMGICVA